MASAVIGAEQNALNCDLRSRPRYTGAVSAALSASFLTSSDPHASKDVDSIPHFFVVSVQKAVAR